MDGLIKALHVWSDEQRQFCIEQYYLNLGVTAAVKSLYCKKFRVLSGEMKDKCPSSGRIKLWVKIHEGYRPLPEETESISPRCSLSWVAMDERKKAHQGWSREQCEFCVEQYYLNHGRTVAVRRLYCEKYRVLPRDMEVQCPSAEKIQKWAKKYEPKRTIPQETEPNKLIGTQWGRKTGENRVLRTESVSSDMGLEHQAIKWKQRELKWRGPRPVNEKEKVVTPIPEESQYYYYQPSVVEEVKPDKKQVMQQKFEEKVLDLIESLDAHGHAARASAFVSLRAELQRQAVEGLLATHRATLADRVSRALRRGRDGERKAAAAVAPLLALQIGEESIKDFVREVRPALSATAAEKSASLDTRIECCSSLAVLSYLVEADLIEILEVMRTYETIFSGSYLKDDGSVNVSGAAVEEGSWHAAALDGWALLLPLLPPNHALSVLNHQAPSFARLGEMLEAVSVEVRMAAGGALAIAYETVTDDDNSHNALTAHVDALLPLLTELARDSNKLRAKRDRKIQRATFRDILKYFEEGEEPCMSVRIGSESASWSSWSCGAAYAALAGALGGALQVLAPRCVRLRAALALSDELPSEMEPQEKPKKLQRHLRNRATSKARNLTRSKNRDKRSSVLVI